MNDIDEKSSKESITIRLIKLILDMPYDRQIALLEQLDNTPLTLNDMKNREDPRKAYVNTIVFSAKGQTYNGISQDLSSGGMFIKTDESFAIGQLLMLTIPFMDKTKEAVKVPAEVVRVTDEGIGVKFIKKID